MESIIVHTKNSMELAAIKSVLKDMNIDFEKFHTKNNFHNQKITQKITEKKQQKIAGKAPKKGL